jgi:DNA-binding NtrC family response regulator
MPTVLVVDDDDAVRGAVSEALGMAGYQVIAVATTTVALGELDSGRAIDLAIVDVKMPPGHPHGFALARMARFRHPTLRLVFMSGSPAAVDPDVMEYEDPRGPVLLKPVRIAELIETVGATLNGAEETSAKEARAQGEARLSRRELGNAARSTPFVGSLKQRE